MRLDASQLKEVDQLIEIAKAIEVQIKKYNESPNGSISRKTWAKASLITKNTLHYSLARFLQDLSVAADSDSQPWRETWKALDEATNHLKELCLSHLSEPEDPPNHMSDAALKVVQGIQRHLVVLRSCYTGVGKPKKEQEHRSKKAGSPASTASHASGTELSDGQDTGERDKAPSDNESATGSEGWTNITLAASDGLTGQGKSK
ncbi:hypothetical protein NCC49_004194 [Naganishia albida]|nr:hypothetical protein NCC49_004194 [Naganishia albida]